MNDGEGKELATVKPPEELGDEDSVHTQRSETQIEKLTSDGKVEVHPEEKYTYDLIVKKKGTNEEISLPKGMKKDKILNKIKSFDLCDVSNCH